MISKRDDHAGTYPSWSSRFEIMLKQQLINAFILKFTQNNPYQINVNFTF